MASSASLLLLVPLLLLAGCSTNNSTEIRLLNLSQDYPSLDVYVGGTTTTTSPTLSAVSTGSLSSYAGVSSGSQTVYFTEENETQSDALSSETETFSQGQHSTYVAYGDTGEFGELEIVEDESTPGSGSASIEVLNTATDAGALDVYLTSSGTTSLANVSPTFSDLAVGAESSFTTVADGTYELSVTGTGNNSDIRLQISGITLESNEVASIIISESAGGYLVNAYVLPQRGSLTAELNPDARVRAAVGLTSGSSISATVGSTALLSSEPNLSIGTYQLVPVGSEPVSVTVSGSAVPSPNQTLAAGQDYTLLIYQTSLGTVENWLVDTNQIPLSGYASLRLVDAMSGLTDPISLAVDAVPIATDVALGAASGYDTEITATTTAALSVTDATTSQGIYSQSPVTLSSQGVYTLFMFGSSASPTGTLNEDRPPPSN